MKDLLSHPFMTKEHDKEAAKRMISHKFFGIPIDDQPQEKSK